MKLKIICDNNNQLICFNKMLKKELLKKQINKVCRVKFVAKDCNKFDICLIISNELEFVYKNSYEYTKEKISKSKVVILTSNLRSANIIGCLNITPYVYYIKTNINSIISKIIKIYEKNTNNLYCKVPEKKIVKRNLTV